MNDEEESMETVQEFSLSQVRDDELLDFASYLNSGIDVAQIKIDASSAGAVNVPIDDEEFIEGIFKEVFDRGLRLV